MRRLKSRHNHINKLYYKFCALMKGYLCDEYYDKEKRIDTRYQLMLTFIFIYLYNITYLIL